MQPNPPQQGHPPYGRPWGAAPRPPKAHPVAALIAGVLAMLTAVLLIWFAYISADFATSAEGGWTALAVQNVASGLIGAAALIAAGGLTLARKIPAAWTLAGLCALYVILTFIAPLVRGTPLRDQITWIFGFQKLNGVIIGLTMILSILTATIAAMAAAMKTYEPGVPPR